MLKVLSLIAVGAIYRLVPHPVNAVPMGALALFAGASLPRRWAWIVPVAAMALSDLVLDSFYGRALLDPTRWLIYATYAATTLMGPLANRPKVGPWLLPVLSLAASTLFFLTSNFGAWLIPEMNYPRNLAGLFASYVAGLAYIDRTVLADLIGTGVLFGLSAALVRSKVHLLATKPATPTADSTVS
jgi:uncharacterized protein DUF6580